LTDVPFYEHWNDDGRSPRYRLTGPQTCDHISNFGYESFSPDFEFSCPECVHYLATGCACREGSEISIRFLP